MSSATAIHTRQEQIDRFVVLNGLREALVSAATLSDLAAEEFERRGLNLEEINLDWTKAFTDVPVESDTRLFEKLWGAEKRDLFEIPEYMEALERAQALQARFLIEIARSSGELLQEAARLLALAEKADRGGDDAC